MALVVIARDGVLFLIAWEVMAIAAYFAATAEERQPGGSPRRLGLPDRHPRRDALPDRHVRPLAPATGSSR